MLLSSCIFRINGTDNSFEPAESVEAAINAANSAAAKGFTKVTANGSMDVYYTPGDTFTIALKGDTASIRRTIVKGDGTTLNLYMANNKGLKTESTYDIDVYITAPTLAEVNLKGSGDFTAERGISSQTLALNIDGSGDIKVNGIKTDALGVSIAGSGDAQTIGVEAKKAEFSIAGSGGVAIDGIKSANFTGSIAGSGDISVTRADIGKANCAIAGSGDIAISGHVGECEQSVARTRRRVRTVSRRVGNGQNHEVSLLRVREVKEVNAHSVRLEVKAITFIISPYLYSLPREG